MFFLKDQKGIPRFLDPRFIIPGNVTGNSNDFTFFPVSDLGDVDISLLRFYGHVRIVWVYAGGVDPLKVKHFSPLFIISPRVL